jgi:predicted DCC family thiol-disulfide oxidoreductase YuxK
MADDTLPAAPYRLVLFDGVCGFCDRAVRWLIARDPERRLCFSPLQGEAAAALRLRHPQIPRDLDTMVYVEATATGERVYLRSEAMFRALREIRAPWRWLAWLGVVPRFLTDPIYAVFVRYRYRVFGKLDACALPDESERARFV